MKTEPEGQLKFGFTSVRLIPQIGKLVGEKRVRLHEWFLIEVLKPRDYYCDYNNPGEPPTDAVCPFCEEGRIQLRKVEPLSSTSAGWSALRSSIGNRYQYGCTNIGCDAEFFRERIF